MVQIPYVSILNVGEVMNVENDLKPVFKLFICHRIPERTFKIGEWYFPVCSRCTGAYTGLFSYFIFVYFVFIPYTLPFILMGILMITPMALDGITQFLNLRESNNSLRFFTGLIGGIGLAILFKAFKWLIFS